MWMVSASGDKATLRNVPWNFEGIESMECGTLCLASGRKNSETYARNVFSSVCVYCFLLILFFCPSISGCNMTLLPFTRTVWISCFGKHSDNNMFKTDIDWRLLARNLSTQFRRIHRSFHSFRGFFLGVLHGKLTIRDVVAADGKSFGNSAQVLLLFYSENGGQLHSIKICLERELMASQLF